MLLVCAVTNHGTLAKLRTHCAAHHALLGASPCPVLLLLSRTCNLSTQFPQTCSMLQLEQQVLQRHPAAVHTCIARFTFLLSLPLFGRHTALASSSPFNQPTLPHTARTRAEHCMLTQFHTCTCECTCPLNAHHPKTQVRKAMQSVGLEGGKDSKDKGHHHHNHHSQHPEEKDGGIEPVGSLVSPRLVSTQTFLKLVKQYAGRKVGKRGKLLGLSQFSESRGSTPAENWGARDSLGLFEFY